MKHVRKRITYANVMSSLAVFLVLGGATAFAATKIGSNEIKANSIITGKIKKEAVTAGKIKNAAVTGGKLADGSVNGAKILDGSVAEADIANEAVGNAKIKNGAVSSAKLAPGTLNPACPSGTTSVGGLCFETGERPAAPFVSAIETCSAAGRLLPQVADLIAFDKKTALPTTEWSGDLVNTTLAFTVAPDATVSFLPFTTPAPYRCVAQPTP
jgi:hypothetical protein